MESEADLLKEQSFFTLQNANNKSTSLSIIKKFGCSSKQLNSQKLFKIQVWTETLACPYWINCKKIITSKTRMPCNSYSLFLGLICNLCLFQCKILFWSLLVGENIFLMCFNKCMLYYSRIIVTTDQKRKFLVMTFHCSTNIIKSCA